MQPPTKPADPFPRLASKLAEVRRRGLTCFGSERHQFRWNAPLTEAEVAAFETEHAIELPEGYRRFLLEAGNGGAGPYYGIVPLADWNWTVDSDLANYLARPSVLRPNLPPTDDWEAALGCDWGEFFQGTMTIVECGCTMYLNLVVSGPHRGRVVFVNTEMNDPPCFDAPREFLIWYECWLDEMLTHRPGLFGMARAFVRQICRGS